MRWLSVSALVPVISCLYILNSHRIFQAWEDARCRVVHKDTMADWKVIENGIREWAKSYPGMTFDERSMRAAHGEAKEEIVYIGRPRKTLIGGNFDGGRSFCFVDFTAADVLKTFREVEPTPRYLSTYGRTRIGIGHCGNRQGQTAWVILFNKPDARLRWVD
jgi:hypothetical protein